MNDALPPSPPPVVGYVRIISMRGLVLDLALVMPFQHWLKEVKADGAVVATNAAIPLHAVDSVQWSDKPFPPLNQMIAQMPHQGSA